VLALLDAPFAIPVEQLGRTDCDTRCDVQLLSYEPFEVIHFPLPALGRMLDRARHALARLRHATWVARDGGSEFRDRLRAFGGFVKTPIATCAPTCPAAPDVKREAEDAAGGGRRERDGSSDQRHMRSRSKSSQRYNTSSKSKQFYRAGRLSPLLAAVAPYGFGIIKLSRGNSLLFGGANPVTTK
jgi:hypothetical protein